MENEEWDWKDLKIPLPKGSSWLDEREDDLPVRGTQLISEIYERCNVGICEPTDHEEAFKETKWKNEMKEDMMEKKKPWELIDKPQDKKIIE